MSAVQEKTALAFDELLKAVEQLSPDDLEHLMKQVLALQAQHKAPCLPATEADLLLTINRCLPAEEQTRFDSLVAKRQANTLTAEEYQELIHMTDEIEKCDAQRIQSLAELARLRGISLKVLMDELGICPRNG